MSKDNLTIEAINNMSEDEFNALDVNTLTAMEAEDSDDTANTDLPDDADNNKDDNPGDIPDGEEEHDEEGDDNTDSDDADNADDGQDDDGDGTPTVTDVPDTDPKKKKESTVVEDEVDYKAFHETLTKPFKANGKEFQIKDPNEAISLMQKGLNYNQKMNQIKPYQQAGRLLEEHGLLEDKERLAFLIDLHNKNPDAIAKLVKDSGVEVYELDEEKANNYKPTPVNIPSEAAIALNDVIASNKENPDFVAVFNDADKWDEVSQRAIIGNPTMLETLANHKRDGVYDEVMKQVNHEINVRNNKTPVMELYVALGKQMYPNDNNANAQAKQKTTTATKVVKRVDPNLEAKRRAAGGTKSTTTKTAPVTMSEEDIYAMDDEAFKNLDHSKLVK